MLLYPCSFSHLRFQKSAVAWRAPSDLDKKGFDFDGVIVDDGVDDEQIACCALSPVRGV